MNETYLGLTISAAAILAVTGCSKASETAQSAAQGAAQPATEMAQNAVQSMMPEFGGTARTEGVNPNFIFMIGDDMGLETLNCYSVGNAQAHTPNLDKLCASGVRFDNFWSQPVCSPTRATLLTGQYGFMNGIGAPLGPTPDIDWNIPGGPIDDAPTGMGAPNGMAGANGMAGGMAAPTGAGGPLEASYDLTKDAPAPEAPTVNSQEGLRSDHYTFIQALKTDAAKGYTVGAVGKWHLAGSENGGLEHPNLVGFDHYTGPMRGGGVAFYDRWSKTTNNDGTRGVTGYVTSDTVNDGIEWIDTVEGEKPFFLWVAFNAPHTPFHMPPAELLTSDLKGLDEATATPLQEYNAMIEAMDTEIGRLVASLEPETLANTYISFMGDNGTPGQAGQAEPYGRTKSKGSLYQGGVNVPFFVAGPGIKPGSTSPSLANSVDIFETVLDLARVDTPTAKSAVHSVSLTPIMLDDVDAKVREYAFADLFGMSGPTQRSSRTIRNERYKLIENILNNTAELYDLKDDPFENNNLLSAKLGKEAEANMASLRAQIVALSNAN